MRINRCDVDDCQEDALFMVGVYSESGESLTDSADVCGVDHARIWVNDWLKTMADIEEDERAV